MNYLDRNKYKKGSDRNKEHALYWLPQDKHRYTYINNSNLVPCSLY